MSHRRVAILISGSGSNMVALVDSMTGDHPARPVLVLSNVVSAGGLAKAADKGIATAVVDHRQFGGDRSAFEAALNATLCEYRPDILCLAGFMRILTAGFINDWSGRMLNTHPSLLPKYRGLNTHARVLEAGDEVHGCTVHEVTAELDIGPVRGQAKIAVQADDTPEGLAARVLRQEHILYPKVLRRFAADDLRVVLLS